MKSNDLFFLICINFLMVVMNTPVMSLPVLTEESRLAMAMEANGSHGHG